MIARLAGTYLAIFACVLLALSVGAYLFMAREYASLLQPVLATPEGSAGYAAAMRHVLVTIVSFDIPLLAVVGGASYVLARASLEPLIVARERQREFATDTAHELRSPLATIAAVAQAARVGTLEETARAFQTIERAALDASSLLADLTVLARDPRPELLELEPVDLAAVAASCTEEFASRGRDRAIAIIREGGTAIVNGDDRRLRELARNLVENAFRHARTRFVIRTYDDGRFAHLEVEDDGPGVPNEVRDRIFERFFRASGDAKGNGLGLTIGRWIARAHGGELALRGSATFDARIPRFPQPP